MTRFSLNNDYAVTRREIPDRAMTLTLPFMPPSTNNIYINVPGKGRVKSSEYTDWLMQMGMVLKPQFLGRLTGRVDITFRLEDKHARRDASNCIKPLEDLLVKVGVIQDDRSKFVRSVKAEWAPIEGVQIQIERVAA